MAARPAGFAAGRCRHPLHLPFQCPAAIMRRLGSAQIYFVLRASFARCWAKRPIHYCASLPARSLPALKTKLLTLKFYIPRGFCSRVVRLRLRPECKLPARRPAYTAPLPSATRALGRAGRQQSPGLGLQSTAGRAEPSTRSRRVEDWPELRGSPSKINLQPTSPRPFSLLARSRHVESTCVNL